MRVTATLLLVLAILSAPAAVADDGPDGGGPGCDQLFDPFPYPDKDCYCPPPIPDVLGVCDL